MQQITDAERKLIDAAITEGRVTTAPIGKTTTEPEYRWNAEKQRILPIDGGVSWRDMQNKQARNAANRKEVIKAASRRERVGDLHAAGLDNRGIFEALQGTEHRASMESVRKDVQRLGLKAHKAIRRPLEMNIREHIREAHREGKSVLEISNILGRDRSQIFIALQKMGLHGEAGE